jgi:hypothetical protein
MNNTKPRFAVVAPSAGDFFVWAAANLSAVAENRVEAWAETASALFQFMPVAPGNVPDEPLNGVIYAGINPPKLVCFITS